MKANILKKSFLKLGKLFSLMLLGVILFSGLSSVSVQAQGVGTSLDNIPDSTQSKFIAYPTFDVRVNANNNKTWNENPNFAQVECYGTICRIPTSSGYQYATGCLDVTVQGGGGLTSGGTKIQCSSEITTQFSTNNPTVKELKSAAASSTTDLTEKIDLSWAKEEFYSDITEVNGGTGFTGGTKVSGECSVINKDQGTKVCRIKNSNNTYTYYYSCTGRLNSALSGNQFSCSKKSSFSGDATKLSDLGLSSTDFNSAIVDPKLAGATPAPIPSPISDIVKALLDFISAVILIFVYLAGFFATIVLWCLGIVFLIIIQINPASSEFLNVAREPWQIVVSIANLLILFSFIYIGFGYLLGLKSIIKGNKWENFVTNILIVGITVNLSLFGAAAFVNFTHGIGDTFIGAYSTTNGKNRSEAIIGDFIKSIEQVSYIRCGAVNVTEGQKATSGGPKCDENPLGTPLRLGEGIVNGLSFNIFGAFFGKKAGATTAITAGEIVYLIVMIYAIIQMWKAMFLAILRVVGLWILMVVSPLALVAYFSPFQNLKKLSNEWWENFSSLAFFYPIFIFGLILIGRISSAFSDSANKNLKVLVGSVTDNSGVLVSAATENTDSALATNLGLVIAIAFASVYMLGLLVSSYNKMIEAIKSGIKTATSAIGGAVQKLGTAGRLGSQAAGILLPGAANKLKLKERLLNNFNPTDLRQATRAAGLRGEARALASSNPSLSAAKFDQASRIDAKIKSRQAARSVKFQKARDGMRDGWFKAGDKIEEWANRDPLAFGKDIKNKWATEKKARLAGYEAERNFNREVFLRENGQSKLADLDKNAKLRGLDATDIAEFKRSSPTWQTDKAAEYRKQAFDRTVGTDARIPRNSLASKGLKLADKYGGDFKKMSADEQAAFVDIVKDGVEVGDIRQQFIGNANMRNMIRDAVDSDSVFTEDQKDKIKRKAPVFIGNNTERRIAFQQAGLNDELFKEFDGSSLGVDREDADAFFQARSSKVGKDQAIKDLTSKAGLRGGFSDFADGLSRDKVLASMSLSDKNKDHQSQIERIDLATRQSMAKGLDENYFIGKAAEAIKNGGADSYDQARFDADLKDYMKKNFGATTAAEATNNATLASNLGVANNESDILAAIQAKSQFKGIDVVAGSDAEKLAIYKAAIARNVDTLDQTKEVIGGQYTKIGTQVADETDKANKDNALLKKAKEEAQALSKELASGRKSEITYADLTSQADLEVMNSYNSQIKKGNVKTTDASGADVVHRLDLSDKEQEDVIRKLNMWVAKGYDPNEISSIRSTYASNTDLLNMVDAITNTATGDFFNKAGAKQTELANQYNSRAKASGGTTVATADQLAEFARTLSIEHADKIKKRNEESKKKITDVHGDADKLINKFI
jgi:hypothetical protein